ncbi:MAG: methyltransferase domain-containing protein [Chlamydiota bacterium]
MTVKCGDFVGERAELYGKILHNYPNTRKEEVDINMKIFNPKKGEKILEIGSGSGLYTTVLANYVTASGEVVATDPSGDQLKTILSGIYKNIRTIQSGAHQLLENKDLSKELGSFDGIWSLGAFHHCMNKSQAFYNFSQLLKPKGRIFICDVFSGSEFARYFDTEVAKYSTTGHEVAYLTEEFFESLCFLFGLSNPKLHHIDYPWSFKTLNEMTQFMCHLHGLSRVPHEHALQSLEQFFEVEQISDRVILHVPLTIFEAYKK